MSFDQKMRIVVASEDRSTSSAIGMLIDAQPDLELAGDVSDIADLLVKIKAQRPELVVLDWEMLGQRIKTLVDLLELFEKPPAIVALSVHEAAREAALASGVIGFAYKGDPPSRLLDAIRELRRDENHDINLNGTGA
jgi:DNA-binding NarL/FixJ family response regulator